MKEKNLEKNNKKKKHTVRELFVGFFTNCVILKNFIDACNDLNIEKVFKKICIQILQFFKKSNELIIEIRKSRNRTSSLIQFALA
jgi:hypothetical protein